MCFGSDIRKGPKSLPAGEEESLRASTRSALQLPIFLGR